MIAARRLLLLVGLLVHLADAERSTPLWNHAVVGRTDLRRGGYRNNRATEKRLVGAVSAYSNALDPYQRQPLRHAKSKSPDDIQAAKNQSRILVYIRLLFLCYYASLGALMPYLPVYYESLGHGGKIIGLLGAVKPATTFLVAPIWGIVADAAASPYNILQITFVVSLLGQLLVSYSHDANYIMGMVFLTAVFNAPVKSLMDSMVLDNLKNRSSYGRLRLWGQLGFGIGSSMAGLLLSPKRRSVVPYFTDGFLEQFPALLGSTLSVLDKSWQNLTGYKLLFFVHLALSVPTWLFIQAFKRQDATNKRHRAPKASPKAAAKSEQQQSSVGQGLQLLLQNPDALLFFFLVFCVGTSSGMIENFAYVRIREVGGTGRNMGLSRLVSSAAGAPMFWFSGPLTKALGVDRVMILSIVSYATRFLIYAVMRNPVQALPAEALRGLTFALFWSASTIYAHKISPDGLHATMIMFVNAMYGGLGQSLGAVMGGRLQDRLGTVQAFGYAAVADGILAATVAAYFYLWRRNVGAFRNPVPIEATRSTNKSNKGRR